MKLNETVRVMCLKQGSTHGYICSKWLELLLRVFREIAFLYKL